MWQAAGVRPDAVIGHSQGEVAAAVVAGGLSVRDGARIVALRSQIAADVMAGHGGMASVQLSQARARQILRPWGDRVVIAAINGPSSVAVSGQAAALREVVAALTEQGVKVRPIEAAFASHSAEVEIIEDRVRELLAPVSPVSSELAFFSTVNGDWTDTAELDSDYWYRNLREPVRFEHSVRGLLAQGYRVFVESSAHPVLQSALTTTVDSADATAVVVGTLRRDDGGMSRFLTSVAELFVRGVPVDWSVAWAGRTPQRVALPTYAFDRCRYWPARSARTADVAGAGLVPAGHPLLGGVLGVAHADELLATGRIGTETQPWLADHVVAGQVLFPGTGFLELAGRAGDEAGCGRVEELTMLAPLVLPSTDTRLLQVRIGAPDVDGRRSVDISSRADGDAEFDAWIRHATGLLAPHSAGGPNIPAPDTWPPAGAEPVPVDVLYERFADNGIDYGPVFRGLRAAWRSGDQVFAEVSLGQPEESDARIFGLHPALLDAVLHATAALTDADDGTARLPFAWSGVALHAVGATAARATVTRLGTDAVSVVVTDPSGGPVISVDSLALRPPAPADSGVARPTGSDGLFRLDWPLVSQPATPADSASGWTFLGEDD
jgi:acyl transferase domain-containing protein